MLRWLITLRFAENLFSSYLTELSTLLEPSTILKQSKDVYQHYAELIKESERVDTENNAFLLCHEIKV